MKEGRSFDDEMNRAIWFVLGAGLVFGMLLAACFGPIVMNKPFCTAPDSCADSAHVSRK